MLCHIGAAYRAGTEGAFIIAGYFYAVDFFYHVLLH